MAFRFKCQKVAKCPTQTGLSDFNTPSNPFASNNCCSYGQATYTKTVVLQTETKVIAPANDKRKALIIVSANAGGAIYTQTWFDEFQTLADAANAPLACFTIPVIISFTGFRLDRKDHGDLVTRSITYKNVAIPSVTITTYEIF